MFCRFDKALFPQAPKYFFVYQVRIGVLPPTPVLPSFSALGGLRQQLANQSSGNLADPGMPSVSVNLPSSCFRPCKLIVSASILWLNIPSIVEALAVQERETGQELRGQGSRRQVPRLPQPQSGPVGLSKLH